MLNNSPSKTLAARSRKARKQRKATSSGRPSHIPDDIVRAMIRARSEGRKLKDVAKSFGCSLSYVSLLCGGLRRSHITQALARPHPLEVTKP
jgi:hypothetical protein